MNKILIIGDSFVAHPGYVPYTGGVSKTWVQLFIENINNYHVVVDGQSSRDVQTIIDKWIISLPTLKNEDILIICIPTFFRTRLPLKKSKWEYYNNGDYEFINKFIGANSYKEGDESIDSFNYSILKLKNETINIYQVLNSTESAITNYMDIINSLLKMTPCYIYVFSWDSMSYKNDLIEDKDVLIENIKCWETLDDVYKLTNGNEGLKGDNHWSQGMNEKFYNYLINNKLKNILK